MGTRFVTSAESGNPSGDTGRIVGAGFADLAETPLFNGSWPDSPHRVLRNSTLDAWEAAGSPLLATLSPAHP
ncbi:hypothetical protein GCM10011504_57930 [Siccirubricoccus deserti]|nr:hypothetical protein GCM10011504_57930 [Siccirubricoccus deserti]